MFYITDFYVTEASIPISYGPFSSIFKRLKLLGFEKRSQLNFDPRPSLKQENATFIYRIRMILRLVWRIVYLKLNLCVVTSLLECEKHKIFHPNRKLLIARLHLTWLSHPFTSQVSGQIPSCYSDYAQDKLLQL